jgi:hypothetical protein
VTVRSTESSDGSGQALSISKRILCRMELRVWTYLDNGVPVLSGEELAH